MVATASTLDGPARPRNKPKSPLAMVAADITAQGYRVVPIMPKSKTPGECSMGRWSAMTEWPRYKDNVQGPFQIKIWSGWEDAGIGVILGSAVSEGWELAALDFDTDDTMMLEMMSSAVPESPVQKRGRRGFTAFYLVPTGTKGRRFKRGTQTICEILTGNATRQTVIPPSIHPDTQQPYVWLTKENLQTLPAARLPRLTEEALDGLVEAVEQFANVVEARGPSYITTETGSPHNVLNTMALQNLDKWVPNLRMDRCNRTTAGYVAVPSWRDSMNGHPESERKPALGFSAKGIRDFSADKPHSPLDVVMLHFGQDLDYAFDWLAPLVGYWDTDDLGDFGPHSQRDAQAPAALVWAQTDALPAHDPETGEILGEEPAPLVAAIIQSEAFDPEALTNIPGLLGKIVDDIAATATRPNRLLALGAAVTVLGTLMGGKICGPTMSGTQLYVIGLAPSGAGKEHPRARIGKLLTAAGAEGRIGPDDFMSMPAVVSLMKRKSACCCPMDEFGSFLKKISDPRAGHHEKGISKILRSIWGVSCNTYRTPEWAEREMEPIHNPCLSIYAVSVPGEFFDALRGNDVVNGFLNRFIMIKSIGSGSSREATYEDTFVSKDLANELKAFLHAMRRLRESAPRSLAMPDIDTANNEYEQPRQMAWADDEARSTHNRLKAALAPFSIEGSASEPFYARTQEIAVRLATIRAAGIDPDAGAVAVADIEWGWQFAMWSCREMMDAAGECIADSEHEAHCNSVVRYMRGMGKPVTLRDIAKAHRKLKQSDLAGC